MTAEEAIKASVREDRIVHITPYNEDTATELLLRCDDCATLEDTHDFWGVDDEGNGWRVKIGG